MTSGLMALLIGVLLTWTGWRHWRYRKEDTINVLEAGILRITGADPLPRTRFDRVSTYVQAIVGFVLGPFFLLIGVVIIVGEMGLL